MDRGMVSEENLQLLRSRQGQYIVGTPKAMLRQFEKHLLDKQWKEVQEGIEVKLVPGPEGDETFVLARSVDRREKEQAMHRRFIARMEDGLRRLQSSAASGRLKDEAVANRRLGRLQAQNWRAAGAFEVTIETLKRAQGKARLNVRFRRNRRWAQWTRLSEGCYLLRTNLTDTDPAYPASTRRSRVGPYPGLLPGLRAMEDVGRLDATVGIGGRPADTDRGVGEHQKR